MIVVPFVCMGIGALLGLIGGITTLDYAIRSARIWRVLLGRVVAASSAVAGEDGRFQGLVEADEQPLTAFRDGSPVVARRAYVFPLVRSLLSGAQRPSGPALVDHTAGCRFYVLDGTGRIAVDGRDGDLFSGEVTAHDVEVPEAALVAYPAAAELVTSGFPALFREAVLRPGDVVTVYGTVDVRDGNLTVATVLGQRVAMIAGKPTVLAIREIRMLIVGALIGASGAVLLAIGAAMFSWP